jgi:hypothetical protein
MSINILIYSIYTLKLLICLLNNLQIIWFYANLEFGEEIISKKGLENVIKFPNP